MDRDLENLLSNHPKFYEYTYFFEASAKPECHNCAYLSNFTASAALTVLERAARLNNNGSAIESIDTEIEERELVAQQADMLVIINQCPGPTVVENDVEQAEKIIRWAYKDADPARIEARIAEILPLKAQCELQILLHSND